MMRSQVLGTAAAAAATTLLFSDVAFASGRFGRSVQGDGYLKVPVGTVDKPKKTKRDGEPVTMVLDNMDFFYSAELEIGSPGQKVTVLVDTGSSELWFNPDCTTSPTTEQQRQCRDFGEYDPDDSDTPAVGPFATGELHYGDPSDPSSLTSVELEYYSDDITFGNVTITNQTFGIVTASEGISTGILGLAPTLRGGFDEADDPYSLVLHSMAEQGVISSRMFSLDLRHAEASTGAVIYGGIDRNKFIGELESMPIVRGDGGEYRLGVEIDSMGLTIDGESEDYDLDEDDRNFVLDSGHTMSRFRQSAAAPILRALDAEDFGDNYFYVPCSTREESGSVNFGFGSKTVRVPFSDFILEYGDPFYCVVGLVITQEQQIAGDSILRAGYFVFDWDNEAVHVAQAANCGDDDIVAAGEGREAVPDVTGNCEESDALFTGGPVSSTPTPTESSDGPDSTGGDNNDSEDDDDNNNNNGDSQGGDDDDEEDFGIRGREINIGMLTAGALAWGIAYTMF